MMGVSSWRGHHAHPGDTQQQPPRRISPRPDSPSSPSLLRVAQKQSRLLCPNACLKLPPQTISRGWASVALQPELLPPALVPLNGRHRHLQTVQRGSPGCFLDGSHLQGQVQI